MASNWQVILRPLKRPGLGGEYLPAMDIADDCAERLPALRQRIEKNSYSYGQAVVGDIALMLHSRNGKYAGDCGDSVFAQGGRENARVDIVFKGETLFTGFVNERLSRDNYRDQTARLTVASRLGALAKTPLTAGCLTPGASFIDAVDCLMTALPNYDEVLGEREIDMVDDFAGTPGLIVRSVNALRERNDLFSALSLLLRVVDGAIVEGVNGVFIARKEARGNDDFVIAEDDLAADTGLNVEVVPARLGGRVVVRLGEAEGEAEVRVERENEGAIAAHGDVGAAGSIDGRFLAQVGAPETGLLDGNAVAEFLFKRFSRVQRQVTLTLQGIHNPDLLTPVSLRINPQLSPAFRSVRADAGWSADDGDTIIGPAAEPGEFGRGYVVEKRMDLGQEKTTLVVRR